MFVSLLSYKATVKRPFLTFLSFHPFETTDSKLFIVTDFTYKNCSHSGTHLNAGGGGGVAKCSGGMWKGHASID